MKNVKTIERILPYLPRYSYSIHKKQMEPITLILIGKKRLIRKHMELSGWYLAENMNIKSDLKSIWVSLADKSYRRGPMWPAFVNGKRNSMGFEMPTRSDTYRRRHHLRLWRTSYKLNHQSVWVGTISYDRGIGFVRHSLIPAHHISPNLINEEEYLAHTNGVLHPLFLKLSKSETGLINTGDAYVWNGKAMLLDLSK